MEKWMQHVNPVYSNEEARIFRTKDEVEIFNKELPEARDIDTTDAFNSYLYL
jgi:5'-deoxynucleotidase YfbR-like HD superfamily hydrolase